MTQTNTNTDVSEFKIIDDEKNTPTLKEAQDFAIYIKKHALKNWA
jgi:hypothetical protein